MGIYCIYVLCLSKKPSETNLFPLEKLILYTKLIEGRFVYPGLVISASKLQHERVEHESGTTKSVILNTLLESMYFELVYKRKKNP
jgi:hypothetical protein